MKSSFCVTSFFIVSFLSLLLTNCTNSSGSKQTEKIQGELYQCIPPCGNDCDNDTYNQPGECSHCHMQLVKKTSIVYKTIQPPDVCNYISKHPNIILLDVRTKQEFEGKADPDYGTLKNAMNIPVQELENRLSEINNLKDKEIIIYCSHSHRSSTASYMLTQHGFTNITNMAGGMSVFKDNSCKK